MKKLGKLLLIAIILFLGKMAYSDSYQLVWSDEFNGSKSTDWVYETGCSFPNRELECYTKNNDVVIDGKLHIQARREADGRLTSARMITRGKKTWTYGKFEMSASLPCFKGSWPAFWLLGQNYDWPNCGEIDIIEQTNTSQWIQANYIWPNGSNSKGTAPSFPLQQFHKYSLEWTPNTLKFYLDDVLFHTVDISKNDIFHKPFFMLINMAIGGDMTKIYDRNQIDLQVGTSKDFIIDYIRVFQLLPGPKVTITAPKTNSPAILGSTVTIQGTAEAEKDKTITKVELNIDGEIITANGTTAWSCDWMAKTTGIHTIKAKCYSTSTLTGDNSIQIKVFEPVVIPAKIEAENYVDSLGIQTEPTTDVGGGKNVGWTDTGDWLKYYVNVATETTFKVDFRVASLNNTGKLELREGTTVLTSLTLNPGTGGWQSWQTKPGTTSFTLPAGIHTLTINFTGPGLNINWFYIKADVPRVLTTIIVTPADTTVFVGSTVQYKAQGYDQFDEKKDAVFSWSVDGGGTIDQKGLFTATTAGGPYTVTASSIGISGFATVTVNPKPTDPLFESS